MSTPSYRFPVAQGPTWKQATALGQIPGGRAFTMVGRVLGAGNIGEKDVIRPNATPWSPLLSPERFIVSSDDSNDTAAGTGAQAILIEGLDINYEPLSEVVELDGISEVTTLNTFFRVNFVTVVRWGSAPEKYNIGNISLLSEITNELQSYVPETLNSSSQGIYTVPANKDLLIYGFYGSIGKNDEAEVSFSSSPRGLDGFYKGGSLFVYESFGGLTEIAVNVKAGSDIKLEMTPITTKPNIVASLYCIEHSL